MCGLCNLFNCGRNRCKDRPICAEIKMKIVSAGGDCGCNGNNSNSGCGCGRGCGCGCGCGCRPCGPGHYITNRSCDWDCGWNQGCGGGNDNGGSHGCGCGENSWGCCQ